MPSDMISDMKLIWKVRSPLIGLRMPGCVSKMLIA